MHDSLSSRNISPEFFGNWKFFFSWVDHNGFIELFQAQIKSSSKHHLPFLELLPYFLMH